MTTLEQTIAELCNKVDYWKEQSEICNRNYKSLQLQFGRIIGYFRENNPESYEKYLKERDNETITKD